MISCRICQVKVQCQKLKAHLLSKEHFENLERISRNKKMDPLPVASSKKVSLPAFPRNASSRDPPKKPVFVAEDGSLPDFGEPQPQSQSQPLTSVPETPIAQQLSPQSPSPSPPPSPSLPDVVFDARPAKKQVQKSVSKVKETRARKKKQVVSVKKRQEVQHKGKIVTVHEIKDHLRDFIFSVGREIGNPQTITVMIQDWVNFYVENM